MSTVVETDVRCPTGSKSLLGKVLSVEGAPLSNLGGILVQLDCKECKRDFRRLHPANTVLRVLHLYTTAGEFKYTQIQFQDPDQEDKTIDLETQVKLFKMSTEFKRPQ